MNAMEHVVRALRGWTLPLVAAVSQAWRTVGDGTAVDPAVAAQLAVVGTELVAAVSRLAPVPAAL
ncbi:MAG: hypothetical protein ABR511_04710 [Acidimicrobiales bacterium]